MARVSFKGFEQYGNALKELEFTAAQGKLLEDAAKAGGGVVADEIRNRMNNLPTEPFRRLKLPKVSPIHKSYRLSPAYRTAWKQYASANSLHSLSNSQLRDLMKSFGLTPVSRDKRGFVHVKAGWDGYGSFPSKTYPKGLPNALLARAVESGSSVRAKSPFVRPAVNASRKEAEQEMDVVVREGLEGIFGKLL